MASKRDKDAGLSAADLTALKKELFGEPPPPGWISSPDLCSALGIRHQELHRFAKRKGWEVQFFSGMTTDGKRLRIRHYKVK